MGLSFAIPGLDALGAGMGLPPLQLSSSARSDWQQNGARFSASGNGDWVVNVAGSGTANQSASATGGITWWQIAAAGAAWYLLKR
jgi:hypothetical protein